MLNLERFHVIQGSFLNSEGWFVFS